MFRFLLRRGTTTNVTNGKVVLKPRGQLRKALIVGGITTTATVGAVLAYNSDLFSFTEKDKLGFLGRWFGKEKVEELISEGDGYETPTLIDSLKYEQLTLDRSSNSIFHRIYYLVHIGQRISEIVEIFTPLAFYTVIYLYLLKPFYQKVYKNEGMERSLDDNYIKFIVTTLKDAGTCFIKFSQWLSTRADILDPNVCKHFAVLHSNAPIHHVTNVKRIVNEQYKKRYNTNEEFLTWVDGDNPLASGAIGQVYKGRICLPNEQTKRKELIDVAIKIRHPNVERQIFQDLKVLEYLCILTNRFFSNLGWLQLQENVKQFTKCMKLQTDFRFEGENLKAFQKNFEGYKSIIFPTPFYYSSNVLVESFEPGISIQHYLDQARIEREQLEMNGKKRDLEDVEEIYMKDSIYDHRSKQVEESIDDEEQKRLQRQEYRYKVAELGTDLFLKMMLHDNLLHADLHPGNILVRLNKETNEPTIVVLDAGMVTQLSDQDRRNFIDLFSAVISGDGDYAAQLMIERSKTIREKNGYKLSPENANLFISEMSDLIKFVMDRPLEEIQVGNVMERVLSLGRQYHVPIESNFSTLVISVVIVEGIARQLNPDFHFAEAAKPFLSKDKKIRRAYIKRKFGI
ncbi:hypothetical protein ABK040_016269 [Willaertia magna]